MDASINCITLIKHFERCSLSAYRCPAGRITIGWGNTQYENGNPISITDKITQERADNLFSYFVSHFSLGVNSLLGDTVLSTYQFDALVSFAYNIGLGNLKMSTLLKKILVWPTDNTIGAEFLRWDHVGGVVMNGLLTRRIAEYYLYVNGKNNF